MKNNKTNKIPVIRYVAIALIVVLIVGALGTLLIGKTSASIEDYDTLLSRVNTLQKRVNTLSGVCDVTTSEVSDAIVINGEVRLPSEGLAYAARADGSGYDVIGIGSCKDINVVVPRTYKGLPVISVSSDFSDPDIESITLYEDVSEISVLTGCDSLRFIYLFSKEPVNVWGNTFEGCPALEGVFVPLGSVDTYKTEESWINSGAADKVVAYETFESTNTLIVNVVGSLQAVDTNLQNQINELKPYVTEGMSYEVTTVNDVPGFKLTSANGACNDLSEVVIPSTYNGYPVLELGDYCLAGLNNNAQGVIIPESVEKLGAGVFAFCSALSRITFLGDVPSEISRDFLMNCPALTEIYVPAEHVDSFKSVFSVYEYMIKPIESLDTLRSDVDAEEAARAEADVNLQNNINNVHNTLNDRITVVDNKIGSVRDVAGEDFIISLLVGNYAEVHLLMAHNGTFKVCSATVFNWGVNVTNLVLTDNQSFSVPVTIDGGVITIHLSQLTVLDSSYSYAGIGKILVKAA